MSILTTLMPYIKERKKGNASKFYIAFLFDGDELTICLGERRILCISVRPA